MRTIERLSKRAVRFYWNVLCSFTPVIRSCWNVLRQITPVSFPLSGKERRLAVSCVSIPRGSGSPLERSQRPCGYRTCLVHFWIVRFLAAIPTEYEGTRGTESATRQSTLLRESLGLVMLSAGSTLGAKKVEAALRPPRTAPKSQKWKPHCGLSGLSSYDSQQSTLYARKGFAHNAL